MKKIYAFTLLLAAALPAQAQSKLDLSGRLLVNQEKLGTPGQLPSRATEQSGLTGAIVTLNPGYTTDDLLFDPQVSIASSVDDMAVVSLPVDMLESLAALDAVKSVSVGTPKTASMYFARQMSGVNEVQAGTELDQPFKGSGVVVGLMDSGVDPNHVNFSEQGNTGVSRVKAVYTFNGTSGNPTATATTPEQIKAYTTDNSSSTHGTHVMGIAAGGYNGTSNYGLSGRTYTNQPMPYYGVAPEADIVMSAGTLYDANIVSGVTKVIEYAESVGKPAAVNLSIGGILGPHDGTSEMSQYLARLGQRALICVAAGNEAGDDVAVKMSGGRSTSHFTNNAVGIDYSTSVGTNSPYTIQFWSNDATTFKCEFVIYNVTTKTVVYSLEIPDFTGSTSAIGIGGSATGSSYNKDANFNSAFTSTSFGIFAGALESNNRYCVQAQFVLNRSTSSNYDLMPAFRITRTRGQSIEGYFYTPAANDLGTFSKPETTTGWTGLNWNYTACSDNGSISDMATGENIISVGAYTSAKYFTTNTGQQSSYVGATDPGDICTFSSFGTNPVTGEGYPLVSAPGSAIVSSLSNYYSRTSTISGSVTLNGRSNTWGPMQGTSMATPFVTGTMGLWLQADPSLTVSAARDIIRKTSTAYTGSDSDLKIQWGAGKINTLEGLKEVLAQRASIGTVMADDDMKIIVTPTPGGYEVFAPGADTGLTVTLFDIQGRPVLTARSVEGTATLNTAALTPGIYVLTATAPGLSRSQKVTVR